MMRAGHPHIVQLFHYSAVRFWSCYRKGKQRVRARCGAGSGVV